MGQIFLIKKIKINNKFYNVLGKFNKKQENIIVKISNQGK